MAKGEGACEFVPPHDLLYFLAFETYPPDMTFSFLFLNGFDGRARRSSEAGYGQARCTEPLGSMLEVRKDAMVRPCDPRGVYSNCGDLPP